MSRWFVGLTAITGLLVFGSMSYAQEGGAQPGRVELLVNPVGATLWTEGTSNGGGPDFATYHTALSATYNLSRYWGIEGEFAGDIGLQQRLDLPTPGVASIGDATPPSTLSYMGNVVYYPWTNERSRAPYVTGGAGALSLLERSGFTGSNQTYFTANVGGGVKYFLTPRWGVRGDYRFLWVNSDSQGPAFFGQAGDRYGHRISGGVVLNLFK